MVRTDAAQTLSDEVYRSLRAAIFAGEYSPGERLLPSVLSTRHDAKTGVIREALGRLAAEGLITLEPNRGFRVIQVSQRSIEDLLELRRINEGAAMRLSVQHSDSDHTSAALAAMEELTTARQGAQRAKAHRDFHGALLSACPNQRLLSLCASLFESSELHRHWSAAALKRPAHKGGRHQDVEHRAILAAVVARDADLAVELHLQHLQRTVELALAYVAFRDADAEQAPGGGRRHRRATA